MELGFEPSLVPTRHASLSVYASGWYHVVIYLFALSHSFIEKGCGVVCVLGALLGFFTGRWHLKRYLKDEESFHSQQRNGGKRASGLKGKHGQQRTEKIQRDREMVTSLRPLIWRRANMFHLAHQVKVPGGDSPEYSVEKDSEAESVPSEKEWHVWLMTASAMGRECGVAALVCVCSPRWNLRCKVHDSGNKTGRAGGGPTLKGLRCHASDVLNNLPCLTLWAFFRSSLLGQKLGSMAIFFFSPLLLSLKIHSHIRIQWIGSVISYNNILLQQNNRSLSKHWGQTLPVFVKMSVYTMQLFKSMTW